MAGKFTFNPTVGQFEKVISAKLGTTAGTYYTDADKGKPVKMVADGRYALCADGDQIEGFIHALQPYTADNFTFGSVYVGGDENFNEATATGSLTFGQYVVAAANGMVKAAPGGAPENLTFCWRVVGGTIAGSGTRKVILQKI